MRRRLARLTLVLGLAACAGACRGYDTIPAEEAAWQHVAPEIVGMTADELWHCAGPPLRQTAALSGGETMIYRYADLENYCQVTLALSDRKVRSFKAQYSAPDFLWLRDGSNYCGQIFAACAR